MTTTTSTAREQAIEAGVNVSPELETDRGLVSRAAFLFAATVAEEHLAVTGRVPNLRMYRPAEGGVVLDASREDDIEVGYDRTLARHGLRIAKLLIPSTLPANGRTEEHRDGAIRFYPRA